MCFPSHSRSAHERKPVVWSQSIRLPDGRVFDVPYRRQPSTSRLCRPLAWSETLTRWLECRLSPMPRWRSWKSSFTLTLEGDANDPETDLDARGSPLQSMRRTRVALRHWCWNDAGGNPVLNAPTAGNHPAEWGPRLFAGAVFLTEGATTSRLTCKPFSILRDMPELEQAFKACGCDPARGEVGIMLERDFCSGVK